MIEFFNEKEKEDLKKKLEPLVFEVTEKINKLETKDKINLSDPEKISFENLVSSKRDVFINLQNLLIYIIKNGFYEIFQKMILNYFCFFQICNYFLKKTLH